MKNQYFNPAGKELKGPSAFQKTHRPKHVRENKCAGAVVNGVCQECGRFRLSDAAHTPNQTGSLGFVHYFSDGSKQVVFNSNYYNQFADFD